MATPLAPTTGATTTEQEAVLLTRKPRGQWADVWRQFRRHRLAMFGLVAFALLTVATMFGPLVYTQEIDGINFAERRLGPSLQHPMGTDDLGQDMLARILRGGRVSIAIGLVAMVIAIVLGSAIGAIAGFFGGFIDTALMRITDLLLSLPQLPLLLVVGYLFRDKLRQSIGVEQGTFLLMVVIIGGLRWMPVARLVRASFLSIKEKEYMEAARCIGVPTHRQIITHMLPNAFSQVIVAASLTVAAAILAESTLSFLGQGYPPDKPTWGRLLLDGRDLLDIAPHIALFPGMMIFITILSINFIGDGLRDALDPRRGR